MKTSLSHPLQIAAVMAGPEFGRIGITFCPGKYDRHAMTGHWDRDLALDLDAVRDWGAAAVVTLLEPQEMALLRVERLGEEVLRRHMLWFHLPIADGSTPNEAFEQKWVEAGAELRSFLRSERDVLVHCRGGLGRAGTIAARLLVELGMAPKKAIAIVCAARPGAIETSEQERFILGIQRRDGAREKPWVDWFERLTGFPETDYADIRTKLTVEGDRLKSLVNGSSYGIGKLELVSLQALRDRAKSGRALAGRLRTSVIQGDVREVHRSLEYAGALFQVASQFNLLEMTSYNVTPEHGVTRYEHDRTQGPARAIAAGAATIYRNYFAPVAGCHGQTTARQLDALADLGVALSGALKLPVDRLWRMQNGYALCTQGGLDAIARYLRTLHKQDLDSLRGRLRIGMHWDIEVTDAVGEKRPCVSQAFCSALPVAYTAVPAPFWEPFASLVLEAAYEATMWAAVLNAQRGVSNVVLLTSLGGGAFGNDETWIEAAIRRALELTSEFDLDVKLVSYGAPSRAFLQLTRDFGSHD